MGRGADLRPAPASGTAAGRPSASSTARSRPTRPTAWASIICWGRTLQGSSSSATRRCAASTSATRTASTARGSGSRSGSSARSGSTRSGRSRSTGSRSSRAAAASVVVESPRSSREQSSRLGQWMDWGNDYYTFSDTNIEYIWRFLKIVSRARLAVQGPPLDRVVPALRHVALAARADHSPASTSDKSDPSLFVRFPLQGP